MDAQEFKPGDLVFLTKDYENYVWKRNPGVKVTLTNRLAKLEKILNWDDDTGKKIKEARLKSGKWKDLPLEDNKYIFSIFFHDLRGRKDQAGVVERGVSMFGKDPTTGASFFMKVPDWIYREIQKKCETFEVKDK